MKKSLKKLVNGGIESIILIVVMVAIVLGLFVAVVLPMVNSAENTGKAAKANSDRVFNSITNFTDGK